MLSLTFNIICIVVRFRASADAQGRQHPRVWQRLELKEVETSAVHYIKYTTRWLRLPRQCCPQPDSRAIGIYARSVPQHNGFLARGYLPSADDNRR